MSKDIAIVYGKEHSTHFTKLLSERLWKEGYRAWYDESQLNGEILIENFFLKKEERETVYLIILSPSLLNSEVDLENIGEAIHSGSRIIPILHIGKEEKEKWLAKYPNKLEEDWDVFESAQNTTWSRMPGALQRFQGVNLRQDTAEGQNQDEFTTIDNFEEGYQQIIALLEQKTEENIQEENVIVEEETQEDKADSSQPEQTHLQSFKDVFISYGRKESLAFASRLYQRLSEVNIDAWFDFVNIPKGDDFQQRIDNGIESADNFIFIISPHSIMSPYCLKEVELAVRLKKRIIPIIHIEPYKPAEVTEIVNGQKVKKTLSISDIWKMMHPVIAERNWVLGKEIPDETKPIEEWKPKDDFEKGFVDLLSLIHKDSEYVQQHTKFLAKALEWEAHQKSTEYLLTGQDREEAVKWMLTEFLPPEQPPCLPTDLHCEFICESRKNAENLLTDVFISYAAEEDTARDKSAILRLRKRVIQALSRYGITTWVHDHDIQKSVGFEQAIYQGVEQADNLVFFISKESVKSEWCIRELNHAVKYNKRIIPMLIEEVPFEDRPEAIQQLQYIDFTDNDDTKVLKTKRDKSDFQKDIDEVIKEIHHDEFYFRQAKTLLVHALKWKNADENDSLILRGYELKNAENFLETGDLKKLPPTNLHREFVEKSRTKNMESELRTDVFISYSRNDSEFARKLNYALQLKGKNTWFDQENIAAGAENFEEEIYTGIEEADNFVFIITPRSVRSKYCEDEVNYAASNGKRIITLFLDGEEKRKPTIASELPEVMKSINWIDFKNKSFDESFAQLIGAVDEDVDYVRMHTRLTQKAIDWRKIGFPKDLLLPPLEFESAKSWLVEARSEEKKPAVTELQENYIKASAGRIRKAKQQIILSSIGFALLLIVASIFIYSNTQQDKRLETQQLILKSLNPLTSADSAVKYAYEGYLRTNPRPPYVIKNVFRALEEFEAQRSFSLYDYEQQQTQSPVQDVAETYQATTEVYQDTAETVEVVYQDEASYEETEEGSYTEEELVEETHYDDTYYEEGAGENEELLLDELEDLGYGTYLEDTLFRYLSHKTVTDIKFQTSEGLVMTLQDQMTKKRKAFMDSIKKTIPKEEWVEYSQATPIKVWNSSGVLINKLDSITFRDYLNQIGDTSLRIKDVIFGLRLENGVEDVVIKTNSKKTPHISWNFNTNALDTILYQLDLYEAFVSPTGSYFIGKWTGNEKYYVWKIVDGSAIQALEFEEKQIDNFTFSSKDDYLALVESEKDATTIKVYDLNFPTQPPFILQHDSAVSYIEFSHSKQDQRLLTSDGQFSYVWDISNAVSSEMVIPLLKEQYQKDETIIFDNDLFTNNRKAYQGHVVIPPRSSHFFIAAEGLISRFDEVGGLIGEVSHDKEIKKKFISPDGSHCVLVNGRNAQVQFFQMDDEYEITAENFSFPSPIKDVTFSDNSNHILISYESPADFFETRSNSMITLIDASLGIELETFTQMRSAHFSPSGFRIRGFTPFGVMLWTPEGQLRNILMERDRLGEAYVYGNIIPYPIPPSHSFVVILLSLILSTLFAYRIVLQMQIFLKNGEFNRMVVYGIIYFIIFVILLLLFSDGYEEEIFTALLFYACLITGLAIIDAIQNTWNQKTIQRYTFASIALISIPLALYFSKDVLPFGIFKQSVASKSFYKEVYFDEIMGTFLALGFLKVFLFVPAFLAFKFHKKNQTGKAYFYISLITHGFAFLLAIIGFFDIDSAALVASVSIILLQMLVLQLVNLYQQKRRLSIGLYMLFYTIAGFFLYVGIADSYDDSTPLAICFFYLFVLALKYFKDYRQNKYGKKLYSLVPLIITILMMPTLLVYNFSSDEVIAMVIVLAISHLLVFIPLHLALENYYAEKIKQFFILLFAPAYLPILTFTTMIFGLPIHFIYAQKLSGKKGIGKAFLWLLFSGINFGILLITYSTFFLNTEENLILLLVYVVYALIDLYLIIWKRKHFPESVQKNLRLTAEFLGLKEKEVIAQAQSTTEEEDQKFEEELLESV